MPRIELDFSRFDEATFERNQARAEWRLRSIERIREERERRLARLRADRDAIQRATDAYADVDEGSVPEIVLRHRFVHLDQPRVLRGTPAEEEPRAKSSTERAKLLAQEVRTRPPLGRLLHRYSNALAST
jgi:hypothetical protein